jgi:tRNA threonylcarbamoyladenosine biosynthesis protein TsaE
MKNENYITQSEDETIELGKTFAGQLVPGDVVAFEGELGTGKTEFIKGICNYFEVDELVTSPTFTIINQYNGTYDSEPIAIYHIDLYRIDKNEDFDEIGFQDCLNAPDAIKLIEWAEKAKKRLPEDIYTVSIKSDEIHEDRREIIIRRNKP